ncbi:MAG: hypothetical protein DHS80DRAFT_21293 [Piptocephalis tieghemiana]|nr:MAG: hypothetical protein DHS80DRAFT_21293 [Piptocephalis tieghemiana]
MSQPNQELEEFRQRWKAEVEKKQSGSSRKARSRRDSSAEASKETNAQVPEKTTSHLSTQDPSTSRAAASSSGLEVKEARGTVGKSHSSKVFPVIKTQTTSDQVVPLASEPTALLNEFQPARAMLDRLIKRKDQEREEASNLFPEKVVEKKGGGGKGRKEGAGAASSADITTTASFTSKPLDRDVPSSRDHIVPRNDALVPVVHVRAMKREEKHSMSKPREAMEKEEKEYQGFLQAMSKGDEGMHAAVEGRSPPILALSDDLLLQLMLQTAQMNMATFLRMAQSCKHLFLLSHRRFLWKSIGKEVFGPWMRGSGRTEEEWLSYYGNDWRRMYIDRPRIRFNGVYICVCSYVRTGWDEESWDQPNHLITYYRYLRFYPDGRAIKLTTTNEPSTVVRTLGTYASGIWQGSWRMDGPDQVVAAFKDPGRPRQTFVVTVQLRGTGRGKHDKLRWVTFQSVDDDAEDPLMDAHSFPLDHFKTCFFSRVRFTEPSSSG